MENVLTGSSGREEPPSGLPLPVRAHPGSSPGEKIHIYERNVALQRAIAANIYRVIRKKNNNLQLGTAQTSGGTPENHIC